MISDERAEKALRYLVDTDEPCALAKAEMERAEYGWKACYSIHNKSRRVEAATFFDENRTAMGSHLLTGLTYAAGDCRDPPRHQRGA